MAENDPSLAGRVAGVAGGEVLTRKEKLERWQKENRAPPKQSVLKASDKNMLGLSKKPSAKQAVPGKAIVPPAKRTPLGMTDEPNHAAGPAQSSSQTQRIIELQGTVEAQRLTVSALEATLAESISAQERAEANGAELAGLLTECREALEEMQAEHEKLQARNEVLEVCALRDTDRIAELQAALAEALNENDRLEEACAAAAAAAAAAADAAEAAIARDLNSESVRASSDSPDLIGVPLQCDAEAPGEAICDETPLSSDLVDIVDGTNIEAEAVADVDVDDADGSSAAQSAASGASADVASDDSSVSYWQRKAARLHDDVEVLRNLHDAQHRAAERAAAQAAAADAKWRALLDETLAEFEEESARGIAAASERARQLADQLAAASQRCASLERELGEARRAGGQQGTNTATSADVPHVAGTTGVVEAVARTQGGVVPPWIPRQASPAAHKRMHSM